MTDRKRLFFLGAAITVLLVLIYHHALRIPYFGDDFQWYFAHPASMIVGNFLHHAPDNEWYRPLQATVLASIQFLWGSDTLPIRIVHFLIHTSVALLIFSALRYWKVAIGPAMIAALYFVVSQASVYPVIANDMVSQMMGSLFAVLTLWVIYRAGMETGTSYRVPISQMALALCFFALSLFSKETSAGICLGVFALFLVMEPPSQSVSRRILSATRLALPFGVVGILYFIMRTHASSVMPSYGAGLYQIHFGVNILKNLGLFAFETVLPFSTVLTMHEVYDRALLPLAGILAVSGLMALFWCYAIWKSERRRFLLILLGFAVLSLVPAVFLNHVSESYLYSAMPYLMVIFGMVIEFYWRSAPRGMAFGFAALLAVAIVANVLGCIEKTNAMAEESSRAQILMAQIYPVISGLPPDGRLYLVNSITHEFEYSVFAMKGFGPVKYADPWILRHTARPDVKLYVLDSNEYRDSVLIHPGTAYTMDMTTLRIKPF